MPSKFGVTFEFGGFSLEPENRTLLHSEETVELFGKDVEILSYLVGHHDRAVPATELAAAVWGPKAEQYKRNLAHHIARIRKILGCDARAPKYIKTFHTIKGYRFIAPVSIRRSKDSADRRTSFENRGSGFEINCHLFVPMFLGSAAFSHPGLEAKSSEWLEYKELSLDGKTLNILPNGFAIWHIFEKEQFAHLWEFAAWRSNQYGEILRGRHPFRIHTRELLKSTQADASLTRFTGDPGYVFSVQVVRYATLRNPQTIDRALKILSAPSMLATSDTSEKMRAQVRVIERKLLDSDTIGGDLEHFGLSDLDAGYASWDGVSYLSGSGRSLEPQIVEFEIAVQSLWWMCKCISEIFLNGDVAEREVVRRFLPDVKRQFAKIKNISATESPSQRTMREAILKTSRLKEMVDEVLDLSNALAP